jgi:teichuronic acid biosynthesis glycosyltransferase TuaG
MNLEQPLVSIIMPSHNSEGYIKEAIKSVVSQNYKNWTLEITDDFSSDSTVQIIKDLMRNEGRINLFCLNEKFGPGIARNKSIKRSLGKYIAFLDSDDTWERDRLSKHIQFMEHNNIAFSHSSYGYKNEIGEEIKTPFIVSNHPVNFKHLLKHTEISCLTAVYNQEIIGKVYMPDIPRKQDYVTWLSILKRGFNSIPYQEVLAHYRLKSNDKRNLKSFFYHVRILKNTQNFSLIKSLYYTFIWALEGLKRYYIN